VSYGRGGVSARGGQEGDWLWGQKCCSLQRTERFDFCRLTCTDSPSFVELVVEALQLGLNLGLTIRSSNAKEDVIGGNGLKKR